MKFSQKAWQHAANIAEAAKNHPFNRQLGEGTLSLDKFACYIEQDALYLRDFARCHAIIASKSSAQYIGTFLRYANFVFISEQEMVHNFFKDKYQMKDTGFITPATLAYTSYLLQTCALEDLAVGIAATLPCFWLYREVGFAVARMTSRDNPYIQWIDTYTDAEFCSTVEEAIAIFDQIALESSAETQKKMLDAFYKSMVLEWHFWNDAYNRTSFNALIAK